jgi:hypothetical protein
MSGWLISGLDRLPARVRRVVVVVAGLLLVGVAIAAVILAPASGVGVRPVGPRPRTPAQKAPARPSPPPVLPSVPAPQLRRAHDAARQFLGSYLSFAYGRARAPARPRSRQSRSRSVISWCESARRRRRRSVSATRAWCRFGWWGSCPASSRRPAVTDGGIATYPLRFTLQRIAGRWSVSSVLAG